MSAAEIPHEVLVDGAACRDEWPLDRGLLYGDGLFETMVVRAGRIVHEPLHAARLAEGCSRLAITADLPRIWAQARVAAQRHGEATLRLQVTRGTAVARGYTPAGTEQARAILAVFDPPSPAGLPQRPVVVTLDMRLGENPALAGLKHGNRLEQVLARLELSRSGGAFEGLLAGSSGMLVSGTMSNVFLELDGELVTPSLDRCGVAGVMRAVVLRTAEECGFKVRVAEVPLEAVRRCSALALSNARMGLLPAHRLDGRELAGSGRLHELAARVNAP